MSTASLLFFASRSFQQAVRLLETYTQCKASFQDLRWAYTGVRRSRATEQRILQEAWATAEPTLGLIASQISDTQMLVELAADDVRQHLDSHSVHDSHELCEKSEAFLNAAQEGLAKGFFGQTVKQLGTAVVEIVHLQHRLGGLGVDSLERKCTECRLRICCCSVHAALHHTTPRFSHIVGCRIQDCRLFGG